MTKSKAKAPTIDTCVISHKPIKQKHIDGKKVISYGKGRAFITAIKNSVSNPPVNPVVLTGSDLEEVPIRFELWNFPSRVKMAGKVYKTFPTKIYLHNAEFRLTNAGIDFSWIDPEEYALRSSTEDKCVKTGVVTYIKCQKTLDN